MQAAIFYILAVSILLFGLLSVTSRKILRAAVYLFFVLGATAGIYFLVDYLFLAAVQLLVYIGGIVVLIVFSILLTSQIGHLLEEPPLKRQIAAGIASIAGALITIYLIHGYAFQNGESAPVVADMQYIGTRMLSYGEGGYILPFELISILLLAAMIGVIVIAKRKRKGEYD